MNISLAHGVLIAFEGIDGAGKTTQARRLQERLLRGGCDVLATKEPTDGRWGALIRASATNGRLPADEELAAFMADRREHVSEVIRPALEAHKVVIIDRYYFSTAAYQGARGMDFERLLAENEEFAPQPHLLFLLDVDPIVGLSRVRKRGDEANLFEREAELASSAAIFRRIERPYLHKLDAGLPIAELERLVFDAVSNGPLFAELCSKSDYKSECEPAYCTPRMTDHCQHITMCCAASVGDGKGSQG